MKRTGFFRKTSRIALLFAVCTFFSHDVFAQTAENIPDSVKKADSPSKAAVSSEVSANADKKETAEEAAAAVPAQKPEAQKSESAAETKKPAATEKPEAAESAPITEPEAKASSAAETPVPEKTESSVREKAVMMPRWLKDGAAIDSSPVRASVTLYADTQGFADGTEATISIVEKDADGNDDDIETVKVQVSGGKIEYLWTVIYTNDDDDSNSKEENAKKGYSLPEYAFTVECGGVKSQESAQLNVTGEGLVFSGVKNNTKNYIALKLEDRDSNSGLATMIIAPNENLLGKFDGAVLKDGTIIKVSAKAPARVNFTINEDAEGNISYVITDGISMAVDTGANIIKNLENSLLNGDKLLSGIYYNQHEEDAVLHNWWKDVAEEAGSPEIWEQWYNSAEQKNLRERAVG